MEDIKKLLLESIEKEDWEKVREIVSDIIKNPEKLKKVIPWHLSEFVKDFAVVYDRWKEWDKHRRELYKDSLKYHVENLKNFGSLMKFLSKS
jgi:hypothetical protein